MHVDSPGQHYAFPSHIAITDERPDIIVWSEEKCALIELTVCHEDNFADAERRKQNRYTDLLCLCTTNEYISNLITIQVGSRGILDMQSLEDLKLLCQTTRKEWYHFIMSLTKASITGSFAIWCSCNSI